MKIKFFVMKQIIVTVERETHNPHKPFVKLFEKIISLDPALTFPYELVSTALSVLFGNSKNDLVISFRLSA